MQLPDSEPMEFFKRVTREDQYRMASNHYHRHHELYCLISGRSKYLIGDELYILEAGDMIFVPGGVFHQTANAASTSLERVLINFRDDFVFPELLPPLGEMLETRHIRFRKEHQSELRHLLRRMEGEVVRSPGEPLHDTMQRLYLNELLLLIFRYRLSNVTSEFSLQDNVIREAVHYINTHNNGNLSVANLASQFQLSEDYFSKLFKKMTGTGVSEYITVSRITAAQEMLKNNPTAAISEVSEACGFRDSNYFALVFKKLMGITPKKYALQVKQAGKP